MGGININKVLVAGLAAGIAMTLTDMLVTSFVAGDAWNAALERLGLPPMTDFGAGQIAAYAFTFVIVGWLLAFTYAGMKTRLGAGMRTATIVAVLYWLFGGQMFASFALLDIFEWSLFGLGAVATLIPMIVGGLVVERLYREA